MYSLTDAAMIQLGQGGSVYLDGTSFSPSSGSVVIAITMIEATKFATLTAEPGSGCPEGGTASSLGGDVITAGGSGDEFPAGVTIYGRWTTVDVETDGAVMAYIGP